MKKIGLVALFALLLAGCDDGGEKKAQENLRKAEAALEKENFNEAKLQIDSIRILYPKAFEARKQGVKLMQQVDLKEQQKSLIYLDSMMVVRQAQLDSVKGNFVLEKDTGDMVGQDGDAFPAAFAAGQGEAVAVQLSVLPTASVCPVVTAATVVESDQCLTFSQGNVIAVQ